MDQHQKPSGTKPINKILKFLPKATSSVSFQNPSIYSPTKEKKPSEKPHKSNLGIGFSGPMLSIVPSTDDHRRIKNLNDPTYTLVFEPTSPRVSCMGQVKCKHYRKLAAAAAAENKSTNKISRTTSFTPLKSCHNEQDQEKVVPNTKSKKEKSYKNEEDQEKVTKSKKKSTRIGSLFRGGRRKSDATDNKSKADSCLTKAPSLGKMRKFSSGRDAFTNFDWTTQVTPLDCGHQNDDEEIKIPASAPVIERNKGVCDDFVRVGGVNLEPRKEINLWKRRTMAQPKPLQLHVAS
ncbi:hypothetical protein QVD17_32260 [Tagetes erecta]|uniref:Syringolide-induced protein 14-1-1 n=1 Tax=Tagetes erecta TaxID=13708 RepID=A0AAD8K4X8_TARER|nr:hypothetical protein QVD17_32260 [Tagetes erecta]